MYIELYLAEIYFINSDGGEHHNSYCQKHATARLPYSNCLVFQPLPYENVGAQRELDAESTRQKIQEPLADQPSLRLLQRLCNGKKCLYDASGGCTRLAR